MRPRVCTITSLNKLIDYQLTTFNDSFVSQILYSAYPFPDPKQTQFPLHPNLPEVIGTLSRPIAGYPTNKEPTHF